MNSKSVQPILVETCEIDGFLLFPTENNNGIIISDVEKLELDKLYTEIYVTVVDNMSNRYKETFKCNENISIDIVKHTLPPLLQAFFELSIRVKKAIEKNNSNLSVVKVESYDPPDTIEYFVRKMRSDANFNGNLIHMIGLAFGLKEFKGQGVISYKKKDTHQKSFFNNNSRMYKRNLLNGVIARVFFFIYSISNHFFKPLVAVIGPSMVDSALVVRGLYGRLVKKITLDFTVPKKDHNLVMRNNIFKYEDFNNIETDMLLGRMNLNDSEKTLFKRLIVSYLIDFYPKQSLEMFTDYIDTTKKYLDTINFKSILTGKGANTKSLYFLSLARENGIKTFSLQHGGYYGYHKFGHNTYCWYNDYISCDKYLTWGWGKDTNDTTINERFVPFVSPWLSERKKYWKNLKISETYKYPFDIVIAPTRLQAYSPVGNVNTIDSVLQKSKDLINFVKELSGKDIRILYKSPSIASSKMYSNSIEEMKKIGRNKFFIMKNIDKGLSLELLEKSAPMILWDVVGTGFLECMSCEIPAIAYVNDYSLYEDNFVIELKKLEKAGVIHSNMKSITSAILLYKNDKNGWFVNKERSKVIKEFNDLFCNTSDNWDNELIDCLDLHNTSIN